METNELPKEVKRKISLAAVNSTIHQTKTDQWAIDMMQFFFKKGAEFGYRLGLQSCELALEKDIDYNELKAKNIAQQDRIKYLEGEKGESGFHKLKAGIQSLKEQLKAKDEAYNALGVKFDKELERWQERDAAQSLEIRRLREALRKIQLESIGVGDYAISPESHELIDSLLTKETCNHPATDKGPSGNIYCVVCLESLEIITETNPK